LCHDANRLIGDVRAELNQFLSENGQLQTIEDGFAIVVDEAQAGCTVEIRSRPSSNMVRARMRELTAP